jgi:hypothetical protein
MRTANNGEGHPARQRITLTNKLNETAAARYGTAEQQFCVNRFSEREAARQLAAICQLLLEVLARDFDINSPSCIAIIPEKLGGVEVRICGHD